MYYFNLLIIITIIYNLNYYFILFILLNDDDGRHAHQYLCQDLDTVCKQQGNTTIQNILANNQFIFI